MLLLLAGAGLGPGVGPLAAALGQLGAQLRPDLLAQLGAQGLAQLVPAPCRGASRFELLAGEAAAANAEVAALITDFGFEPIDLGRHDEGGLLQQFGGPLTTRSFISQPIGGAGPAEMDLIES